MIWQVISKCSEKPAASIQLYVSPKPP